MSLYDKHKKLSAAISARPGWQHPFNVVQKRRRALLAAQEKANKKWEKKAQNQGGRRRTRRKRSRRRRSRSRTRHRRRRTRRGGRRQRYATNDKYWVIDLQTAADGVKKLARRHGKPVRKLKHHTQLLLHDVMYGTSHLDRELRARHSSSHHKSHHKKSHHKKSHKKHSRRRRKTRYGMITGLRNSP